MKRNRDIKNMLVVFCLMSCANAGLAQQGKGRSAAS